MTDQTRPSDRSQRRVAIRVMWTLLGIFLVASAAAVIVSLVNHSPAPGRSTVAIPHSAVIACGKEPQDETFCSRLLDDQVRRGPLTAQQTTDAQAVLLAVRQLVDGVASAVPCSFPTDTSGSSDREASCEPTLSDSDVNALRQAFLDSGHADAVVRLARPTDPAPVGGVLWAVPSGSACLVGFVAHQAIDGVFGTLSDGQCLPT